MGLAVAAIGLLMMPIVTGLILIIVATIVFIICKKKKRKPIGSYIMWIAGGVMTVGLISLMYIIALTREYQDNLEYNNLPNKVYFEYSSDEFEMEGERYVAVDYLNRYLYKEFEDTEYNATINQINVKMLRRKKIADTYIYSGYGNNLYCHEDDVDEVWEYYRCRYTGVVQDFPITTSVFKDELEFDNADELLRIWRWYLEHKDEAEDVFDADEIDRYRIKITSEDELSEISIYFAIDENENWYYVDDSGYSKTLPMDPADAEYLMSIGVVHK